MGPLTSYSIAVAIILALEYLAYKSLMARTTNFRLNRMTILASYVIALIALPASEFLSSLSPSGPGPGATVTLGAPTVTMLGDPSSPSHFLSAIPVIYISGVIVMVILTVIAYAKMASLIRSGEKRRAGGVTIVTVDSDIIPFSWGRYIIVSRSDADNSLIMSHELLHISHSHSVDLIFARLMTIFNWFNPAAWLMADELSACHEFEVDHQLLSRGANAREYQLLIIKKAAGPVFQSIANSLNHSQLKNRLTMMKKSKTKRVRSIGATALLLAAMLGVAVTNYPAIASTLRNISAADLGKDSEKITTGQIVTPAKSENKEAVELDGLLIVAPAINKTAVPESAKHDGLLIVAAATDETAAPEPAKLRAPAAEKHATEAPVNEPVEEINAEANPETLTEADAVTADKPQVKIGVPDESPSFPGGEGEMMFALSKEVKYPEECVKSGAQGRTIVQFTVTTEGTIRDIKVMRSAGHEALDKEAVRAVGVALKEGWKPGRQDGKPVNVVYTLPVTFRVR